VLPYPGGRHPRRGFLEGAVDPQRDTKVSIFPPWDAGGYVVVDVPEAVFSNLGLTYLAHTHIPTIWDAQRVELLRVEWEAGPDGLSSTRSLPNGIRLVSRVESLNDEVLMEITLHNGTTSGLTGLRVQVCTLLKGAVGFQLQETLEQASHGDLLAVKARESNRWIVTGWKPRQRMWTNPPVPCFHVDPQFPDCGPGETVRVEGRLFFYEGDNIVGELKRRQ